MAKTEDNLFVAGFRGTVGGNMVFRRKRSGSVVVAKKGRPSDKPPTDEQVEIRELFTEATEYAGEAMKDAALKAAYAARVRGDESAYNLALRDARIAPKVRSLTTSAYNGQPGSKIVARAIDDFKVVSVKISIFSASGPLIEEGECTKIGRNWIYTATVVNEQVAGCSVKAVAMDTPGNEGSLEAIL